MATIFDIARVSGVSRSTVSRVINGQPGVRPEKRQRVLEAIKDLHYTPNAAARVLAMHKTHTIGIFVRELGNAYYAEFLKFISHLSDDYGYGAIYCNRNNTMLTEVNYLERLNKQVDGYIFLGECTVSKEELTRLVSAGEVVITVGFDLEVEGVSAVTLNNYEATYDMTRRLIQNGHRHLVYMGYKEMTCEFFERIEGFKGACFAAGVTPKIQCDIDFREGTAHAVGTALAKQVSNGTLLIDGIVCSNDTIAIAMIDALMTGGIQVPDQISVVGFDNIYVHPITTNHLPNLTTVGQPQEAISRYVVEHFLERIQKHQPPSCRIFECEPLIQESARLSLDDL